MPLQNRLGCSLELHLRLSVAGHDSRPLKLRVSLQDYIFKQKVEKELRCGRKKTEKVLESKV